MKAHQIASLVWVINLSKRGDRDVNIDDNLSEDNTISWKNSKWTAKMIHFHRIYQHWDKDHWPLCSKHAGGILASVKGENKKHELIEKMSFDCTLHL